MLDQPVPNPLAKNPNIYTHKVFATIGLILVGVIVVVAGIWYFVGNNSGTNDSTDTTNQARVLSAFDNDNDGIKDSVDKDDDNDGVLDVNDAKPKDHDNDSLNDDKDTD